MKKNKFMRLASALLVLTLLSTCAISGTFAKYTTSANGSDSATVAKWGVTVSVTGADGFATSYATDDTSVKNTITNSVIASADTSTGIVAPGTKGTLASYSVTGTPEVATKTTVTPSFTVTGWNIPSGDTTAFYCPITVTVGKNAISGLSYETADAFQTAVINAAKNEGTYKAPNTSIESSLNVTWEWAFEDVTENAKQTNEKDTALGNLDTAPTISFGLIVTVDQVN